MADQPPLGVTFLKRPYHEHALQWTTNSQFLNNCGVPHNTTTPIEGVATCGQKFPVGYICHTCVPVGYNISMTCFYTFGCVCRTCAQVTEADVSASKELEVRNFLLLM